MQYIDNDMDELFNKAGRDYPLKTDNGNWDAVFGKLQQPETPAAPLNPKTNRKYYWWLFLLLLPLSYLVYDGDSSKKISGARNRSENKINTGSSNTKETVADNDNNKVNGYATQKKTNVITQTRDNKSDNVFKSNNIPGAKALSERHRLTMHRNSVRGNLKNVSNRDFPVSAADEDANEATMSGAKIDSRARALTFSRIPVSYFLSPYSITPHAIETTQSPETKKPKHLKTSGIYAGLLAGPDLSTVKYQKIKNTGFSIGVLAGYRFSNRWSVEAGLLYNKKKYFTDGKYFDKSGTNIPPSVYIEYLDGACEMFEVPISVRYNFSKKENTVFATAGITSYFMNEEEYEYGAWSGGNWYEGYKSYDNSGNHIFSNMQFSIGYNYKLSKKLNLRIEPYIKIPVSEIGIGNLPITSTGVYFGIMRKFR